MTLPQPTTFSALIRGYDGGAAVEVLLVVDAVLDDLAVLVAAGGWEGYFEDDGAD